MLPLALTAAALVVPASASAQAHPADPGTLEICKNGANGVIGNFQFSVNGGSAITVPVGGCSGPVTVASGEATVTELAPADSSISVVSIKTTPRRKLVSADLDNRTAVVKVAAGSSPSNETLVTFTNGRVPGELKVCKVAGDLGLLGDLFSFSINGGSAFSVAAGSAPSGNCSSVRTFAQGTIVNVHELATAGTHVSSITVSDGRGSGVDLANGNVTATIGTGVTIVTYTNNFNGPPQTGFIEVCKEAADRFTSGTFHFTITPVSGGPAVAERDVMVGQCSEPIQVQVGDYTVAERAKAGFFVSRITGSPASRLLGTNLINGTATVRVVQSADSSDESLVTFFNAAQTGQLKVCKTLTSNSSALAGGTFTFDINASTGLSTSLQVVAGSAGTTACRILPQDLPVGTVVSVTERGTDNVRIVGVDVSPADRDNGSGGDTANLTIGPGITTATFTNQALGTIEICKLAADPQTLGQVFQFTVNGGAAINVRAGQCSNPIQVPAGTATVRELAKVNFVLVSIGTNPADRLISSNIASGTATVSAPFGGVANETVVNYTNAVQTGQFKVCKSSSEPSLQGTLFTFTITVNGVNSQVQLRPGECSALSAPLSVIGTSVTISEAAVNTVVVDSIDVAGNSAVTAKTFGTPNAGGSVSFNLAAGITAATFDNARTAL